MKIASMMLSWAMRAAAFSLVSGEPSAVEQKHDVGGFGERR